MDRTDAKIRLLELEKELEQIIKPEEEYCGKIFIREGQQDYIEPEGKRLYVDSDIILSYFFRHVCKTTKYKLWKTSLEFLMLPFEKDVELIASNLTEQQIAVAFNCGRYRLNGKKMGALTGIRGGDSASKVKYFKHRVGEVIGLLPIKFLPIKSDFQALNMELEDTYHRQAAEDFGADYFVSRDWNKLASSQTKYPANPPEQFLKTFDLDTQICKANCFKNHAADNISREMRKYYRLIE